MLKGRRKAMILGAVAEIVVRDPAALADPAVHYVAVAAMKQRSRLDSSQRCCLSLSSKRPVSTGFVR